MNDNRENLNPASDDFPVTPTPDRSQEHGTPEGPATYERPAAYEGPAAYEQSTSSELPGISDYPSTLPPPPPSWLPQQPVVPVQRSRGRAKIAAGLTALVLVSAGTGGAVAAGIGSNGTVAAAPVTATTFGASTQTVSSSSSTPLSYAAIAAKVLPVVVSIDVVAGQTGDTGSGIMLTSDGYILTNNHVVTAASSGGSITVHFNDGSTAPAKIVGTDLASDLAVIKVAKTGLTAASIGDSSALKVGDAVLAVGSPLGLTGTVTSGIVSALNRPVDTTADQTQSQGQSQSQSQGQSQQDPYGLLQGLGGDSSGSGSATGGDASTTSSVATVFGAIQTDAAINPGNSGGALVDASGNVIGINSAIASLGASSSSSQSGNIGVGFAIPINLAKQIAKELITSGKATHAQIGVSVQSKTDSTTGSTSVVVGAVTAGGPGATAGLQAGDVITKIDSSVITDADTLIATVRSHAAGDKVTLTFTRGGVVKTATLAIGSSSS